MSLQLVSGKNIDFFVTFKKWIRHQNIVDCDIISDASLLQFICRLATVHLTVSQGNICWAIWLPTWLFNKNSATQWYIRPSAALSLNDSLANNWLQLWHLIMMNEFNNDGHYKYPQLCIMVPNNDRCFGIDAVCESAISFLFVLLMGLKKVKHSNWLNTVVGQLSQSLDQAICH